MRHYWFNSGLAVLLTLLMACTGGVNVLWRIFATANQLLAGMVLALAGVWLLRQRRKSWFAFAPAVFMLVTTATSLALLLRGYLADLWAAWQTGAENLWPSLTLTVADLVLMALTAYLLVEGVMTALRWRREKRLEPQRAQREESQTTSL
jgi:carbon starvation protein CstA